MASRGWLLLGVITLIASWSLDARAGDVKIHLPKHSTLTPVQLLNREGVDAIRKHNYEQAESLFYKAYLFDPDDPFTLNNLGYISELQGQVDRAHRFYTLAGQQATDAVVDVASSENIQGRSIKQALALPETVALQINRDNVDAVRLLSQGRAPEVDLLLQKTLKLDPRNIFTLNNMGVAKEMEGESQEALTFYDAAAAIQSDSKAIVTVDRSWRGKPVSEMAASNAKALRNRLEKERTIEARVAEFNLRGVSAVNRNDLRAADEDFRKAFSLAPNNAFAMNNIGFVSEIEGDRETAASFYGNAQKAGGANLKVGLATRKTAEGIKLAQVASENSAKVETKLSEEHQARRRRREPILLRRRDNSVVQEPSTPPSSESGQSQNSPPQ